MFIVFFIAVCYCSFFAAASAAAADVDNLLQLLMRLRQLLQSFVVDNSHAFC